MRSWILRLLLEDRFPRVLGTEPGRNRRSAATVVASAPDWSAARTRIDEPIAGGGAQHEGLRCKEEVVARSGTPRATGFVQVSADGRAVSDAICWSCWTEAGAQLIAELTQAIEQEVEKRPGARSNACRRIRSRFPDSAEALRADHRESGTVSSATEADRGNYLGLVPSEESSRRSSPLGTYHETGQLSVALLAGGSGAGYCGAQRSGMAQPVFSLGDATGTKDRARWRWPAGSRFVCTGCGARDADCQRANEVRSSHAGEPDIAMVCSQNTE